MDKIIQFLELSTFGTMVQIVFSVLAVFTGAMIVFLIFFTLVEKLGDEKMIEKVSAMFGVKYNKRNKPRYKSPYDVPVEKQCENCAYHGTDKCTGVNCFSGIMERIAFDEKKKI